MAFDINKAREHRQKKTSSTGNGFNIDKARSLASSPGSVSDTISSIRSRRDEAKKVRVPFSTIKDEIKGGPIIRGTVNIISRMMEDIVVGGLKVAATVKGEDVNLPFNITSDPFLTGETTTVTTSKFRPMSEAALARIEQLDRERPEKSRLNLIQGATEEVFLPLLDAVDIIGLGSLATRLVRKQTLTKPAQAAFDTLRMGVLSDTSETGIRKHIGSEIQSNIKKLESGKISTEQFIKRQDEIGDALDVLTEAPQTRFGKLGERTNRLATALEAERKIGKSITEKGLDSTKRAVTDVKKGAETIQQARKLFGISPEDAKKATKFAESLADKVDSAVEAKKVELEPEVKAIGTESEPEAFIHLTAPGNLDSILKQGITPSQGQKTKGVFFGKSIERGAADVGALNENIAFRIKASKTSKYNIEDLGDAEFATSKKVVPEDLEVSVDGVNWFDAQEVKGAGAKTFLKLAREQATIPPKAPKVKPLKPLKPEKKVSKLGARINEILPEGSKIDEYYDVKTIKEELEKAAISIEKNPTKALSEALDTEKSISSRAAKLMEFAQAAKDRGDVSVQSALLSKMRVLGTEIAQGLNMFKAFGFRNPETDFMEQVVNARLRKVAVTKEDIAKAGTTGRAYNEKVYKPVRKEIEKVKREAFKVKDAQELFDKLIC